MFDCLTSISGRKVFLVSLLLAMGIGSIAIAAESPSNQAARFTAAARARAVTDDRMVLTVGQEPVMLSDFLEGVAVVTGNTQFMQSEIESHGDDAANIQTRLELIQQAGIQTVALAGIVEDRVLYQAAQASGITVPTQDIAAQVDATRSAVEHGAAPELQAYIEVVGAERYWSVVYPALVERNLAVQRLWTDIVRGLDRAEAVRVWNAYKHDTIHAAAITIVDPAALQPATLDAAIAYLDHLYLLPS